MRKNIIYSIICLLFLSSVAVNADSWDDLDNLNNIWDGQKTITNKDFDEVVDALQQKQKQKDEKVNKKKIKKISGGGESLHRDLDYTKDIPKNEILKLNEDGSLVNVTMRLFVDENVLEKGYYKVIVEKEKKGDLYISFYQSQFLKGKMKVYETDDDFGEETIDFAKILPYNEQFVKLIYGSAKYNAYVYIPYGQD